MTTILIIALLLISVTLAYELPRWRERHDLDTSYAKNEEV